MAKDQQAKEQITIFVEPEDLRKLNALSRATLAPRGALIRAAIKNYLELELRKAEAKRG
jgi:predicted transcriptional regulator